MEHSASSTIGVALITTFGAFIGALISHFLIHRRGLDLALYKQRGEAYKGLWQKTSMLSRWPQQAGVTYSQLQNLSEELRHWYYFAGGEYLSDSARKAYGNLQKALNDPTRAPNPKTLSPSEYTLLQDLCSKLRTELTHDLLSRKRMFVFSR
ncbi:MAG TPA: hypothetical protein VGR03_03050 [Candidatus Acidoferrum sp.]|nr:hypothetical protein [Candidatus Acidoferrum sp.]